MPEFGYSLCYASLRNLPTTALSAMSLRRFPGLDSPLYPEEAVNSLCSLRDWAPNKPGSDPERSLFNHETRAHEIAYKSSRPAEATAPRRYD